MTENQIVEPNPIPSHAVVFTPVVTTWSQFVLPHVTMGAFRYFLWVEFHRLFPEETNVIPFFGRETEEPSPNDLLHSLLEELQSISVSLRKKGRITAKGRLATPKEHWEAHGPRAIAAVMASDNWYFLRLELRTSEGDTVGAISAIQARTDRLIVRCRSDMSGEFYVRLKTWLVERFGVQTDEERVADDIPVPNPLPPDPTAGAEWDDVFDWYYRQTRVRSIKGLAEILGLAPKTVYNRHASYVAQYGKAPKPDLKK